MTSLCATSDNSHGAPPIRTPGTKKNGSGLTQAKLFIRTCSASLPTQAGARTWGTSKSPNCEVSIPAASTNLGGDGARLDSERKVPRSVLSSSSRLPRIEVCRTPTGCLDSRRILLSFISQTVVLVVPVSTPNKAPFLPYSGHSEVMDERRDTDCRAA